jgi:hypothetical protein
LHGDEFVSDVVFVDIGDVVDGFLADAGSSNEFHIVHPDVGVEPFLSGLRSQLLHASRTTIVGGEGEEHLVEVIHVWLVTIKSFHRGTKIFDARMNIRLFLGDIADGRSGKFWVK